MSECLHLVMPEKASEALRASRAVVNGLHAAVQSVQASVDTSRQHLQESYVVLMQAAKRLARSDSTVVTHSETDILAC